MPDPRAIIIAGPNGAGKTTFARTLFDLEFEGRGSQTERAYHLNADEIAKSVGSNISAGKRLLTYLERAVDQRQNFVVETTLASKGYLKRVPHWQSCGYDVSLHFLKLPTPEAAVQRVSRRVAEGGHDIPRADIVRRFYRGLDLFANEYKVLVDRWEIWHSYEGGFESVERSDPS